ncbi:MAG: U32 family peptidase, partial [Chitinispirillia bacterium]|nr:U32 family peptidase [Chitinispirillia bacterium]
NPLACRGWASLGAKRIILSRELSFEEIKIIRDNIPPETELECFVHGAMCVSVSGRCLLGTYFNSRHPNLGDCSQPCRLKYKITPDDPTINFSHDGFIAEESSLEESVYLLNSKDLCTIEILPQIIESGVVSLKIEGRSKSAHYAASVIKVYREAIHSCIADPQNYKVKKWWIEELEALDHRAYTTGFYMGEPVKQDLFASKAQAGYRLVATVKAVVNGRPVIDVKNSFHDDESLNVLPVKNSLAPYELTFKHIEELDGKICERAIPNRLFILDGCSEKLRIGDMLRRSVIPSPNGA